MNEIPEVSDLEMAFGTTKYLLKREDIPKEFWCGNTKWNTLFSQLFFNGGKGIQYKFKPEVDQARFFRWYRAHACSFEPQHEAKEAGVAYFMSQYLDDWKLEGDTES